MGPYSFSSRAGAGGRVRGHAPGFYLRCPPVGAAPRINIPILFCSTGGIADVRAATRDFVKESMGEGVYKYM